MTRMDERERSAWVAALASRIRRLLGTGRPDRPPTPRPGAPSPARRSRSPGAEEGR